MPNTIKQYKITQLQQDDSLLELHPETDADIVNYSGTIGSTTVTNVKDALDAIGQGIGVTGVKGNAESTYRTGQVNLTPANIGAQPVFTDGSATIASEANSVVTIKTSVTQSGGAIAAGSTSITLAKVAKTGSYNDLTNKPTLGTAASKDTGTSSGNVPVLDSNGKLSTSVLPAIAVTDTFTAASQAAMLALTAQKGDICIRTDVSKTFILTADGASTLANWKELATPTDAVTSVCGKTGVVTLDSTDISNASSADGDTVDEALDGLDTRLDDIEDGTAVVGKATCLGGDASSVYDEGSHIKPVYFANGIPVECDTYAGGTCVHLNGSDDGDGEDVAFYAPTGGGTAGQVLTAGGTNTAPSWVNQNTIAAGTAANFASAKTIALTGDVTGSASGGASGGWSIATTLASISGLDTTKAYSAYKVNAKGQVVSQGQMIEVGATGQTAPSASLAVGGLFFQEI